MKHLTLLITLFILNASFLSQQYFVEFIVDDVPSIEKARSLESKLRGVSEYQMVRMDFHTGRCFIIMKDKIKRTEVDFKKELLNLGYEISCFYIGQRGKDPFIDIKRGNCK